ncbi:aldehyde dehydrogenase family protein [Longimicrobium sp.]|uniref:aldehyde dehydrogenase family protein n=1 Tax=Longimicrobium sp. TaxID=2029185 RepID=UPI002E367D71|nr:aldehyde dehydrogenase family protein [Longimicrobium sp.]HEX6036827.1 aldehyde dehydrogenase family protein [Longimicrobium sp.]
MTDVLAAPAPHRADRAESAMSAPYLWIGGVRVETADAFDVRSPYDGALAGRAGQATAEHVCAALDGAAGRSAPPPEERAAILDRAADHYATHAESAARLITAEAGICLKQARHEVHRAVNALRGAAHEARRLAAADWEAPYRVPGESPAAELHVIPEPVTLAIAITPFNHPLNQVAHKVAPAIAAGAPVVLKPSEKTPLSALRLAEVLAECGLPPHLLNVVTGRPAEPIVRALVCDPRAELVSFTGSVAVGKAIARTMAEGGNELVRYLPELGGNAALVVLADADVERAARIALGAFDNAGQRCTAINRILVQEPVADAFTARLAELASALSYGDPWDERTDVGPVIDEASAIRIERAIDAALGDGARLLVGGSRAGAVVAPTVIDHVRPEMEIVRRETFGPVAPIVRIRSVDDAIRIVRADNHRLSGAIATRSEDAARAYAAAIRVGQFSWNGPPGYRTETAPFGGFGDSGNGEKEGIVHATRAHLHLRTFYRH